MDGVKFFPRTFVPEEQRKSGGASGKNPPTEGLSKGTKFIGDAH